jgi:Methyltransferase domain
MLAHLLRGLVADASRLLTPRRRSEVSPPVVDRRHGSWHGADIEWMAGMVQGVAGDMAEIGVFRGNAFKVLAGQALRQNKTAHAFDSFVGMDDPSPDDGPEYPKGRFSIGGAQNFAELMTRAEVPASAYRLWEGYIPRCFEGVPVEQRFSLVVIDVDHYRPTVDSLAWACPRISPGGILALDDFLPDGERYASKAIKQFLHQDREFEKVAFFNQQLILRRK